MKLHLRKESLSELTADELRSVVGGQSAIACIGTTDLCTPSYNCTGYYPSLNAPCDSAHC